MTDEQQPKSRRELRAAERTREIAELERRRREAEAQQAQLQSAEQQAQRAEQRAQPTQLAAQDQPTPPQQPLQQPLTAEPLVTQAESAAATPDAQAAASREPAEPATAADAPTQPDTPARPDMPASTDTQTDIGGLAQPGTPAQPDAPTQGASADDAFAQIFGEDAVGAHKNERRAPAPGRRRRIVVNLVVIGLIIGMVVGAGVLVWNVAGDRIMSILNNESADYEGSGNGTEVEFTVLPGDTGTDIANRLEEQGVVRTSGAFIDAVLARPEEPQFQPGTYRLQEEMSSAEALVALLDENNRIENTLTIPEGTRETVVFELVQETYGVPMDELKKLAAQPQEFGLPEEAKSLEGFLFPATYTFAPDVSGQEILQTMVDRSFQALDEQGVAEEDRWQTVLMASLVEREARIDEDFPKVARVFYNRLEIDMPLQSDATVTYWTEQTHRAATTDDERADESNPYNTYVHKGMIPAPISNPGDRAIEAAVHPADGEWLYFVTVNLETGETVFSNTLEEHEQAVEKWLKWMEDHPDYE